MQNLQVEIYSKLYSCKHELKLVQYARILIYFFMQNYKNIVIKGARVNNLKNIDVVIPKNKITVITGLSGSGKSSLAFDTLFAEGQRRYIESLSNYAKQFLGTIPKPEFDHIEGLSPAISIDQRSWVKSPRSTVATMSDIYDYLRLLFARAGVHYCPKCKQKLTRQVIKDKNNKKHKTAQYYCPDCEFVSSDLTISAFSFNSPEGACPECRGLGKKLVIDPTLIIPNPRLTLLEGAIRPWSRSTSYLKKYEILLQKLSKEFKFSLNTPIGKLSTRAKNIILYGTSEYEKSHPLYFEGVIASLESRYKDSQSDYVKQEIKKFMVEKICPNCHGARLKPEVLAVKIEDKNIFTLCDMSITEIKKFLENVKLTNDIDAEIIKPLVKEIITRLGFLEDVGLHYLTLSRGSQTLSGGEAQRIKLATQLGAYLTGVIYILDEPSIGLHPSDQYKLIDTLRKLRDLGNTVVVVEHDRQTIEIADYIIDLGPGAGEFGGEIVASGAINDILKSKRSLTAKYMRGDRHIAAPTKRRISKDSLIIKEASEHNLKNIDVTIPLNNLVCLTGVSGSGKSSLINDILAKSLKQKFYHAKTQPGAHKAILGTQNIDKVIVVDQSPIGKTPRSNPVTYTGILSIIREIYTNLPMSKTRRYNTGHFSFNVIGGRCETCKGDGALKFEMYFLPDAYITCPVCNGKRYNKEILDIVYTPTGFTQGKNIAEVLEMTVTEALKFFSDHKLIYHKLKVLEDVGLGYIRLGQSATTLSGGEAQRIKLATELGRKDTSKTLYILDEPTTGLHFEDIKKLLVVLQALVDKGNSVIIIEHNSDVVKSADYIIDMGPEGGDKGGQVVAAGTPEEIVKNKKSLTGKFIKQILN